jgi:isoleucyl-tRNA synthetase
VDHVADIFEQHGADAWFEMSEQELLPPGTKCPSCGSTHLTKDKAILDVWFDSGVSHAAVVKRRYGEDAVADLYLEGSDQHRGWFQSSLLASVGVSGQAPYKTVVTHGFVVDGAGKKLSKSARNFVAPQKTIDRQGAEIFRLWVSAENYKEDIRISDEILKTLVDAYRKFRNTFRFMLGNLGDFDPSQDMVPDADLLPVDRYALSYFRKLVQRVLNAYDRFDFHVVYHSLISYTFTELSAFYLDITKDRLYCSAGGSLERRSAQTALYRILRGMLVMLAPILSFTAEEAYQELPKFAGDPESIFLLDMVSTAEFPEDQALDSKFSVLTEVRTKVLGVLEQARADGKIGHPLEAAILLKAREGSSYLSILREFEKFLPELFVVSSVQVQDADVEGFDVSFDHAPGGKCQRCWNFSTTVGSDPDFPDVCARCAAVLRAS